MNEPNNDPLVTSGGSVGPDDGNRYVRKDDVLQPSDLSCGSQIAIDFGEADEPAATPSANAGSSYADDPMRGMAAQINSPRKQKSSPEAPVAVSTQQPAPSNGEPSFPQRKKRSAGSAVVWSLTFLLLVMAVLVFYLIAR